MDLKKLLLTFGIVCTTAGSVISLSTNKAIQVKAEDVKQNIVQKSEEQLEGNEDEAIYKYHSEGFTREDNVRAEVCVDLYYISHYVNDPQEMHEYDYEYFTMTIVRIDTNYTNNGVKIVPTFNLLEDAPKRTVTSYRVTTENDYDAIQDIIDSASTWSEYLLVADYENQEYYNWKPEAVLSTPQITEEYAVQTYVYISNWGYHEQIYTQTQRPAWTPYNFLAYTGIPSIKTELAPNVTEVIDVGGMMLQIISMPFTFISTAFNVTLFPGTQYQINIGNFIMGLIAILTILFIIKVFTGGLDIVGNITNTAHNNKVKREESKGFTTTTTTSGTNSKGSYSETTTTTHKRNK